MKKVLIVLAVVFVISCESEEPTPCCYKKEFDALKGDIAKKEQILDSLENELNAPHPPDVIAHINHSIAYVKQVLLDEQQRVEFIVYTNPCLRDGR